MRSLAKIEDYHHQTNPTARKDHRCCECDCLIIAGQSYHVRNGCKEGCRYVYKTCNECESLYIRIRASVPEEDAPVIGKLAEAVTLLGRPDWIAEFARNANRNRRTVNRARS